MLSSSGPGTVCAVCADVGNKGRLGFQIAECDGQFETVSVCLVIAVKEQLCLTFAFQTLLLCLVLFSQNCNRHNRLTGEEITFCFMPEEQTAGSSCFLMCVKELNGVFFSCFNPSTKLQLCEAVRGGHYMHERSFNTQSSV